MSQMKSILKKSLPCKYLRCKEMFHETPGAEETEFASDAFWCSKTQEPFGPDGVAAEKGECNSGRSCYLRG